MNSTSRLPRLLRIAAVLLSNWAVAEGQTGSSLADLSIEQLLNESVRSVGKKETRLGDSPAAISVVTGDDIRQLGFTTLPETLRLVPGVDVARVSASTWAVSARGFNNTFASRLLVLQDGRSIYTPLFGGVYWDVQDLMLEDLDRIEVIRGPGGTLWGANAVNGVINITTKSSRDTQGGLVSVVYGTEERPTASVRYGGELTKDLHFRVYAKTFQRDGLMGPTGAESQDRWRSVRAGFRADWEVSDDTQVVIQGDAYAVNTHENVLFPTLVAPFSATWQAENRNRGANLLGRWTRSLPNDSELSLQTYWDGYRHTSRLTTERRDTADLELQYRFPAGQRNEIVSGLGYRFTTDSFTNSAAIHLYPLNKNLRYYNAFVQDEITLLPEKLELTVGSKFEHNAYTGWEVLPNLRVAWHPSPKQTVWSSVSRAVSSPTRIYAGSRVDNPAMSLGPNGPILEAALFGNPNLVSETLTTYELGYRVALTPKLSFDASAFFNQYRDTFGFVTGTTLVETSPAPTHLLTPLVWSNSLSAQSQGVEAAVQWKPLPYWRVSGSYSQLRLALKPAQFARGDPEHQISLHSYLSLPHDVEFNSAAFYVEHVEAQTEGGAGVLIPSYLRLDLGFTWHPTPAIELGIWGQNLLDARHEETVDANSNVRASVPRSVTSRITVRF